MTIRIGAIYEAIAIIIEAIATHLLARKCGAVRIGQVDEAIAVIIEAVVANFGERQTIVVVSIDETIPIIVDAIGAIGLLVGLTDFRRVYVEDELVGVDAVVMRSGKNRDLPCRYQVPKTDQITAIYRIDLDGSERRSRDLLAAVRPERNTRVQRDQVLDLSLVMESLPGEFELEPLVLAALFEQARPGKFSIGDP